MPRDPEAYKATCKALERVGEEVLHDPGAVVELDPCIGDGELSVIAKRYDRPCPRVDLMEENELPALVARATMQKHTVPIATAALIVQTLIDPDDALPILGRVLNVLTTEKVLDLLYPAPPK